MEPPPNVVTDPSEQADVVVVCVTYNSAKVIGAFLASLPPALESLAASCRVVITDNDSADGTPELVTELAPWATVVRAGRNAGYAGGINLALDGHRPARGAYVLNPDTLPAPGSVALLLAAVEDDPRVGIAVPRVIGTDGSLQLSLRREPTIARALGEAVLGGSRAARSRWLGETIGDPDAYHDGARADWATGAAMFISRRVLEAAGEWDERFFLYSEETDYALRSRDAGHRLQLVERAHVVHQGGDQAVSPRLWALSAVNRTRLYRKRHGRLRSTIYWAAVLLNELSRAVAGIRTHRAAVRALLAVGPNQPTREPTTSILARAGSTDWR